MIRDSCETVCTGSQLLDSTKPTALWLCWLSREETVQMGLTRGCSVFWPLSFQDPSNHPSQGPMWLEISAPQAHSFVRINVPYTGFPLPAKNLGKCPTALGWILLVKIFAICCRCQPASDAGVHSGLLHEGNACWCQAAVNLLGTFQLSMNVVSNLLPHTMHTVLSK